MSDDVTAGGAASGEQKTAGGAGDSGSTNAGEADTDVGLASLADDAGAEQELSAAAADTAADDWRVAASGGDEKVLRELKRYANPQNVAKALVETKAKLRAGLAPPSLPDGATDEQVAEYRKALGVPENPEGYGVQLAPELAADENLSAMLQNILTHAHARHVPAPYAKAMVDAYQEQALRAREEQVARYQRDLAETDTEMRRMYGAQYERAIGILREHLALRPAYKEFVLANVHRASVMKEAFEEAMELASEEALYGGDADGGGKSIDEQIADFRSKSVRGKLTEAEDKKYMDLLGARERRDEKRRNRAA